jgi:uncharacterized protein (TIGR03000 family)
LKKHTCVLILLVLLAPALPAAQQALATRVIASVPAADAELVVDGAPITGTGSGTTREFTRQLAPGRDHPMTFTVTWMPNSYTTMTRTKTVTIRPGGVASVDLAVDDPTDRVRVIYVPTPTEVVDAMVELAAVRPDDVVFEPGCGDARITIAAIRKGARRGLCVDIDAERARESKDNVEKAGYADRIEVREGDALDVKELTDVSVVMLYMGDHFDMLIRPVLWRDLKVGSRIVSHRFTMGDWPPDRTVNLTTSDGGYFDVHLWTITEEVKRRAGAR